jgi:hypothetical protein
MNSERICIHFNAIFSGLLFSKIGQYDKFKSWPAKHNGTFSGKKLNAEIKKINMLLLLFADLFNELLYHRVQ